MKKRVLIILLAVVFCLSLVMVVACDQTHVCESKCSECNKCTNMNCNEDACKDKCQGHDAPTQHICGHVCPTCNKCTDSTCTNSVCQDKCQGHGTVVETVKATGINITGYDEEGNDNSDGTIEAPYIVSVSQGHDVELGYNVRPTNATDRTVSVTVGKIEDGAFVATPEAKLTATVNTRITLAADADLAVGGGIVVEVKANDGSDVATYLNIVVTEYVSVSQITSSALKASEEEGFDYELLTAVGTNWNMSDGITQRGQKLLAGEDEHALGLRAPTNLVYFPNIYNLGLTVLPNNASEKDYTITYSENDIVAVESDGALTVKNAGETVVTVTSDSNNDVTLKIKVTVVDTLYRGLLKSDYEALTESTNVNGGWDFDTQHATEAQASRFNDWRMVMVFSNLGLGDNGGDEGQKIFCDGATDRPYGIAIENHVNSNSGASLLDSTGMMWAKVTIPEGALTFSIKMEATGSGKEYSEYRVVFVNEDGVATVMTDGWMKTPVKEATIKVAVPEAIKGQKGALIIETRATKADESVEFHAKVLKLEGQVDVTGVVYDKDTAEYKVGERVIDNITASVRPNNATNDKVTYAMHEEDADKGVTVDANTGVITVSADAVAGTYRVIATSVADNTKTATLTITLTNDEIEVNEWKNKDELLNGVSDVKWTIVNGYNSGAGEGIDLSTRLSGDDAKEYSAAKLANRKINVTSFIMAMSIRTFPNEKTQEIVFKLIDSEGNVVIIPTISGEKAIADNDPAHDGKIDTYYYDLSEYIGGIYDIELGVTGECYHAVITAIKFTGSETKVTSWANKTELLDNDGDPWTVEGNWNSGPSEGIDLQGAGSYTHNTFVIGAYNAKFTFGAKIFAGQEGDKGFPDVKLVVVCGGEETVVKAIGQDDDTITIDHDPVQQYSFDLSAFTGKEVEIRIVCVKEVHHCVIANAQLTAMDIVEEIPDAE